MKILLVEDEPFMQEAMSSVIERNGVEVIKAGSLKEAMEVLDKEVINLIITDLYLPQPDGYKLIEQVKNNGLQKIPVIVVTGYEQDTKDESLKPDVWLMKPFTLSDLRKAIQQCLPRQEVA